MPHLPVKVQLYLRTVVRLFHKNDIQSNVHTHVKSKSNRVEEEEKSSIKIDFEALYWFLL